jgi:hypothetical protein
MVLSIIFLHNYVINTYSKYNGISIFDINILKCNKF